MSALEMTTRLQNEIRIRAMSEADLDAVMAIENVIYTHPWTRGNFVDSMNAGSHCWIMEFAGVTAGYVVLSTGAGEAHLLNLSIGAAWQRRGLGRWFISYVIDFIEKNKIEAVFLEVRVSNAAARALYAQSGFHEIGMRRGYYPAPQGREDAIVLEFRPSSTVVTQQTQQRP